MLRSTMSCRAIIVLICGQLLLERPPPGYPAQILSELFAARKLSSVCFAPYVTHRELGEVTFTRELKGADSLSMCRPLAAFLRSPPKGPALRSSLRKRCSASV